MANRKKAEEFIIRFVNDADKTGVTANELKKQFAKMDDKRFHEWMVRIKEEKEFIPIIMPNCDGTKRELEEALDVCDKYGVEIFQRYWTRHEKTGIKVLSNVKAPFVDLPVRRQIETIFNKMSTSDYNGPTDILTGQGIHDASAITQPETMVSINKGLTMGVVEKLKYRGGDVEGGRRFDKSLIENGSVSIEQLHRESPSSTRSTQTLDIQLTCAMYETNLDPYKAGQV